jgi:hypothetical protein
VLCLAADDHAPAGRKARWLATYSLCLSAGYALGYMFGGLAGSALGWRAVFLFESAAMAPFALFCLRAVPVDLRGTAGGEPSVAGQPRAQGDSFEGIELLSKHKSSEGGDQEVLAEEGCDEGSGAYGGSGSSSSGGGGGGGASLDALKNSHSGSSGGSRGGAGEGGLAAAGASLGSDVQQLATHPVYLFSAGGMVLYAATLSTLAYYSPKAGRAMFQVAPQVVDVSFGAINVGTGEGRAHR